MESMSDIPFAAFVLLSTYRPQRISRVVIDDWLSDVQPGKPSIRLFVVQTPQASGGTPTLSEQACAQRSLVLSLASHASVKATGKNVRSPEVYCGLSNAFASKV